MTKTWLESHLLAYANETVSIFTVCGAWVYMLLFLLGVLLDDCVLPKGDTSTRRKTPCLPSVLSCYALMIMSVCVCVFAQQWEN